MPEIKKICVSLDSLLDTRLGVLNKIDLNFAVDVSTKEDYYLRTEDLFSSSKYGQLSKENYNLVKNKFLQEIISYSPKTKMNIFLRELCVTLFKLSSDGPNAAIIEVDVNVFPYKLTDIESKTIMTAVNFYLGKFFKVNIVSLSDMDLNCNFVADTYSALIMYDYGAWLNLHSKDIQRKKCKDVSLYCPKINFIRALTEEEGKQFKDKNMSIFEFLTFLMTDFIILQYLPICLFSADTPINKDSFFK